jgi:uncharacterized protein (TIGR00299 family) protein
MRIAFFDTIAGIAGDMTLAAFVSAGFPLDELNAEIQKLGIAGVELSARHLRRSAIDAVHIDVVVPVEPNAHRHLSGILSMIERSGLSAAVQERAHAIFRQIAAAEAKIHGTDVEKVHFHEVGAVDSIVDIVGTAICIEHFGIERVYSTPVRLGCGGVIRTQHGVMPVPAPATLEILRDYPVVFTSIEEELTTPTGAAIIKALSSGVLQDEAITAETVGYGAGLKEFRELPNLLRLVIGHLGSEQEQEEIHTVEANIDDMNPQLYPAVIEQLLERGAHDAYLIPIIMKKGRPGILLSAMVPASRLNDVTEVFYRETSTIGLRIQVVGRRKLPRRQMEITTSFGRVAAKAVLRDGKETVTAEFEECKRIARETGMPLLEVMRILEHELKTTRKARREDQCT